MTGRAIGLAVLVALAPACRNEVPVAAPAPVVDGDEPAVVDDDARAALAGAVLEIYSHLSLGNTGAYVDLLATSESIALVGLTADGTVVGRSPRSAARDRRLFRAYGPSLLAKNLDIELSADGSVGWVYDEMSYRVTYLERTASIPIRQTSVWIRDFDRWVEVVEHWSYGLSAGELRRLAAAGQLPAPRHFTSFQRVAPARDLLALVGRLHNSPGAERAGMFVDGERALILLPEGEYRGAAVAQAPSLAQLFGADATVGLRDYRLGLAKNGEVAWMVANLAVRTTVNDDPVEIGLRATYLFEHDRTGWRAVQLHVSAPVTPTELARRVFGAE